jgi:hypothetical protein
VPLPVAIHRFVDEFRVDAREVKRGRGP